MMKLTHAFALAAVMAAPGCADEFDEYNQVVSPRLLAIRATPPDLAPDAEATLDALVTTPDASHQWSWCPAPFGGTAGDTCPITEAEFRALVAEVDPVADPPPYDLGSSPAISFRHSMPPELLQQACGALGGSCDGRVEVSVRLAVSADGLDVVAVRELGLMYDDSTVPNDNPVVRGAEIGVRGAPPFELSGSVPTSVVRDVEYTLELDIDDAHSQPYETNQDGEVVTETESLVVTWFFEAGEMDKMRSSYLEGTTNFDNLRANRWRTPTATELEADQTTLYFVLRDSRGGLDWFTAALELRE